MSKQKQQTQTVEIGGRQVGAFVERSEYGSNRILSITPIPLDGADGWAWARNNQGPLDVWGVQTSRGQRIADAYRSGQLPCNDTDKMNRILRPDEFE